MQVNIDTPNQEALTTQAQNVLAVAESFVVDSPTMYQLAGTELQQIKGGLKQLEEKRKSITKPLDEAKAAVMDLFRKPVEILQKAETTIKRAILTYDQAEEAKRKAEEERLREITRKEQEKLRIEADRRTREAAEKAAKLREEATVAAAAGNAAEAAKLAAKSEAVIEKAENKAADLQQQADTMPVPVVNREQVKVSGISKTTLWRARVMDDKLVPREYLIVNQSALDQVAKATKGALSIPGVEFYSEEVVRSASR